MIKRFLELIAILAMVVCLGAFVVSISGCQSTPQSVAYKATDATLTTADQAIAAWADYVVKRQVAIAAMTDPIAKGEANDTLLRNEGKVSAAYADYQKAAKGAILVGSTASGQAEAPDVVAAAASLIAIVTSLLH